MINQRNGPAEEGISMGFWQEKVTGGNGTEGEGEKGMAFPRQRPNKGDRGRKGVEFEGGREGRGLVSSSRLA